MTTTRNKLSGFVRGVLIGWLIVLTVAVWDLRRVDNAILSNIDRIITCLQLQDNLNTEMANGIAARQQGDSR